MIRLRDMIERGLRHRWLGPLVLLLLAVLLAAVLIHEGGERLTYEVGELCMALLVLAASCVFKPPAPNWGRTSAASGRPGPWTTFGATAAYAQPPPRTLFLRL